MRAAWYSEPPAPHVRAGGCLAWRHRGPAMVVVRPEAAARPAGTVLPGARASAVALDRTGCARGPAAQAVVAAAEALLAGSGRCSTMPSRIGPAPDWFRDPLTGRQAPRQAYCFRVPYRDEAAVGNIKFVWELSRHQPTTLLACAWWLTGDDAVRRAGGGAPAIVVAGQPVPVGRALGQRHRGGIATAVLDLDTGAAGRLAGVRGAVRR